MTDIVLATAHGKISNYVKNIDIFNALFCRQRKVYSKNDLSGDMIMAQKTEHLLPILLGQNVIPVLVIDKLSDAVPLARALVDGGLKALERRLRIFKVFSCRSGRWHQLC